MDNSSATLGRSCGDSARRARSTRCAVSTPRARYATSSAVANARATENSRCAVNSPFRPLMTSRWSSLGVSFLVARKPPVCATDATPLATATVASSGRGASDTARITCPDENATRGVPLAAAMNAFCSMGRTTCSAASTAPGSAKVPTRKPRDCENAALCPLSPSSRALRRRFGVGSSVFSLTPYSVRAASCTGLSGRASSRTMRSRLHSKSLRPSCVAADTRCSLIFLRAKRFFNSG